MKPSGDYGYDQIDDHDHMAGVVRKGPWTEEEDSVLVNYVSAHGEGQWNALARMAGLRRTGKSCRLRWLNYLRPDVRRGNISLEEQLLILQLHSRWGNRWSKIAQELPGRTDNEIKNYWRTRVQKQAKQLKCDVNSQQFRDTMRHVWMPRLVERIQAASATPGPIVNTNTDQTAPNSEPHSSDTTSWDTFSDRTESLDLPRTEPCLGNDDYPQAQGESEGSYDGMMTWNWQEMEQGMTSSESMSWENMVWNEENVWFLQQQLYDLI